MLYHNENDSDGIQQVLTALHQYVSYYGDGDNRVYSSQGLVADQLSVERGVNALFELANGFTPGSFPDFFLEGKGRLYTGYKMISSEILAGQANHTNFVSDFSMHRVKF